MFTFLRTTTKNALTLAIVSFVVSGALLVGTLFFIGNKTEHVSSLTSELGQKTKDQESLRTLRRSIENTTDERTQLDMYFLKQDEIVSFIEVLEGLGEETGVTMSLSDVEIVKNPTAELEVQISTKGDWENVMQFLSAVEQYPLNIFVKTVGLRKVILPAGVEERKTPEIFWQNDITLYVKSFISS